MTKFTAPHCSIEKREKISRLIKERRAADSNAVDQLATAEGLALRLVDEEGVNLLPYNCYAYALGVHCNEEYKALVRKYDGCSVLINSSFVASLIDSGFLNEKSAPPTAGDLIIYFAADGRTTHAAILMDEKRLEMRSKWGPIDALHQHGLWEVDTEYGNVARVFYRPESREVLKLLEAHLNGKA